MESRGKRWAATTLLAAGLFVIGGIGGAAQDATPTGGSAHAHPAHIHLGTCDKLDPNPTYPLTDVALAAEASGGAADGATAIPVERSVTTVDAALEDLRTGGYAINIHQSAEDIGTYIACGNLSGVIDDSGALVVGLGALNDSGYSGVAILTEQGEQTNVSIYLTQEVSEAAAAADSSASDDSEAVAEATTVEIKNLAYTPDTVEIPVGATVTWTNNDTVPHTATAKDRDVLQSGTLKPGDTYSQTFDQPGTYDYFCEFHANMKGTIIVK